MQSDLSRREGERVTLIGDGAEITYDYLRDSLSNVVLAPCNIRIQRASSTALAAFERIREGKMLTDEQLMPVYLRLPQAQRELNKRMGVTK